jgi:hypothetical protein
MGDVEEALSKVVIFGAEASKGPVHIINMLLHLSCIEVFMRDMARSMNSAFHKLSDALAGSQDKAYLARSSKQRLLPTMAFLRSQHDSIVGTVEYDWFPANVAYLVQEEWVCGEKRSWCPFNLYSRTVLNCRRVILRTSGPGAWVVVSCKLSDEAERRSDDERECEWEFEDLD